MSPALQPKGNVEFYQKAFETAYYAPTAEDLGEAGVVQIKAAMDLVSGGEGVVLEIGSGRGTFQDVCSDHVALDLSRTSLSQYIKHGRRIQGTAEQIPLKEGSCRLIFSFLTLEHVVRADLAFLEIHRCLAPGGVVLVSPCWHNRSWYSEGLDVRPYSDLSFVQKLRKLTIPLRCTRVYKAAKLVPHRLIRRLFYLFRKRHMSFRYWRLKPNYQKFWRPDADAASSLDAHEAILFFESRGYEIFPAHYSGLRSVLMPERSFCARKPDVEAGGN